MPDMIEVPAVEQPPIEVPGTVVANTEHFGVVDRYRNAFGLAKKLAASTLLPESFRGNPENCMIAVNMADRIGMDPLFVAQNIYVVKGKPQWSGSACMAILRAQYKSVKPVYTGTKGTQTRGCYIKAVDADGDVLEGTEVTMQMAASEGWTSNSKWKNMPEQMLAYRAASFFARIYCPEILMGFAAEGEAEDSTARVVEDVL